MRRPMVMGNWKMNGSRALNSALLAALREAAGLACDLAVCPPAVYLADVASALKGSSVTWGGQDCSAHEPGAYTGEVAAVMLRELGCTWVILGHSERRARHAESDQLVADKAKVALAQGLTPIVCVGESLAQREGGQTTEVVKRQLSAVIHTLGQCVSQIVVAYEPVWAIGTGRTASPEQAQEVHAVLRAQLAAATPHANHMRLIYGGSLSPDNAKSIFAQADIDGGLIGGASLRAADFLAIARAAA